ncbi:MAG: glutamate--tRNA ligase 2, partial [Pseudomonadota bacterium]
VDDHDMGVTHVIRGDDHLTNTFRQLQIYEAMGWTPPDFAHMSLIHGADGAKLSKRHGALGVEAYRDMGFLPEAMFNYLLRLGWSHGDDEIIGREQAIAWFDLDAVGRAPARFDMAKLASLNAHYIKEAADARLIELIAPRLAAALGKAPDAAALERLGRGLAGLKPRAQTLVELADKAMIYVAPRPLSPDAKAVKLLAAPSAGTHLAGLADVLAATADWAEPALEAAVKTYAAGASVKLGEVAQPLRAALTGRAESPGLFEVMAALGREESLARIGDALAPR